MAVPLSAFVVLWDKNVYFLTARRSRDHLRNATLVTVTIPSNIAVLNAKEDDEEKLN